MVAEKLPPEFTGSGKQAMYLSEALRGLGCKVTALCSWPAGTQLPSVDNGIQVVRLICPPAGWRRSLEFALKASWWLVRNRSSYDVIHVHGYCWAALVVPFLGKPCIYKTAIPGDDDPASIRKSRGGWLKSIPISRYDAYPAISTLVARVLTFTLGSSNRVKSIPNGVDARFSPGEGITGTSARKAVRIRYNLPEESLLVLYLGSLQARKGVDLLARAWLAVVERIPRARLLMVGPHDPQGEYIQQLKATLGDNYKRTAAVGDRVDDPLELYRAAELFVFPSRNESFGNVLVEAMACGCACVATRIDGVTEEIITSGHDGVIVPPENPGAIAGAILDLLNDEPKRHRLAENALRTVEERYKISKIAERYLELYAHLCHR